MNHRSCSTCRHWIVYPLDSVTPHCKNECALLAERQRIIDGGCVLTCSCHSCDEWEEMPGPKSWHGPGFLMALTGRPTFKRVAVRPSPILDEIDAWPMSEESVSEARRAYDALRAEEQVNPLLVLADEVDDWPAELSRLPLIDERELITISTEPDRGDGVKRWTATFTLRPIGCEVTEEPAPDVEAKLARVEADYVANEQARKGGDDD